MSLKVKFWLIFFSLWGVQAQADRAEGSEKAEILTHSPVDWNVLEQERSRFLTPTGYLHKSLLTTTGLAQLAEKHYNGNMALVYDRGKQILKVYGQHKEPLFWFRLDIDSQTFFEQQSRLYHLDGTLKNKYRHAEGQVRYAKDWHSGDMLSAYVSVLFLLKVPLFSLRSPEASSLLNFVPAEAFNIPLPQSSYKFLSSHHETALFRHLDWSSFPIVHSVAEWQNQRHIFMDQQGQVKSKWQDMAGQIRYAKQYTNGDLFSAWKVQKHILNGLSVLNWQAVFHITAEEVENIIQTFLEPDGRLKSSYISEKGYRFYAKKHTNQDLNRAFKYSRYLPSPLQNQLKWHAYQGYIEDQTRDKEFMKQNPGMSGLLKLARLYYNNDLTKAYQNCLSLFKGNKKKLYEQTGYLPFYRSVEHSFYLSLPPTQERDNTVEAYERDKIKLTLKNGKFNPLYKEMAGYIQFANDNYGGDMGTAYHNAKSVLENKFSETGWMVFPGTTAEFQAINQHIKLHQNTGGLNQPVKAWIESFIRAHHLMPHYETDIKQKIKAILNIKKAQLCQTGAFSTLSTSLPFL